MPSAMRSSATPRPSSRRAAGAGHRAPPFPGQDFSSFLLQAQASGAKVIGLANAGGDTINSIKQAAEFGITQAGQNARRPAGLHHRRACARPRNGAGPGADRSFYWDLNDDPRVVAALRGESQRQHADDDPCRRLFLAPALLKAVEELGSTDSEALWPR
jgi:branched-chain amino acid transport system substrate-binding protein